MQSEGRLSSFRADFGMRNLAGPFADAVTVSVVRTGYRQDETEDEDGVVVLGTRFDNATTSMRGEIAQKRTGRLNGRAGLEWLDRDFRASGEEALSPATRQRALSAFAYEEVHVGATNVQFGARVERTTYTPGQRPRHDGEDDGDDPVADVTAPPAHPREFTAVSGSLGAHIPLGADRALVANLTSSSRAPALEELSLWPRRWERYARSRRSGLGDRAGARPRCQRAPSIGARCGRSERLRLSHHELRVP